MINDDLLKTFNAPCHATPTGRYCCCCYLSHHHQHQTLTETAEKEVKRLRDRIQHALDDLTEFNDKGMAVRVLRDALAPQPGGESETLERS